MLSAIKENIPDFSVACIVDSKLLVHRLDEWGPRERLLASTDLFFFWGGGLYCLHECDYVTTTQKLWQYELLFWYNAWIIIYFVQTIILNKYATASLQQVKYLISSRCKHEDWYTSLLSFSKYNLVSFNYSLKTKCNIHLVWSKL